MPTYANVCLWMCILYALLTLFSPFSFDLDDYHIDSPKHNNKQQRKQVIICICNILNK